MSDIWSFSKLSSYHNCKYAWYLTYVEHIKGEDNIYGVLGNSTHDCLELMCKDEMTIEEAKALMTPEAPRINKGRLESPRPILS